MRFPLIDQTNNLTDAGEEGSVLRRWPAIALISLILAMGSAVWGISQSFTSYRIDENQNKIYSHMTDNEQHMSMERKIQFFVLRQEYEKDIKEIKANLEAVLVKLDKLKEEQ